MELIGKYQRPILDYCRDSVLTDYNACIFSSIRVISIAESY